MIIPSINPDIWTKNTFKNKKQIFDVEREVPPNPPPICNFQKSEKRLSWEIKQTRVLFLFQSSKREIELKKTLCLDTRCRNASHAIIVVGVCLTHTRTHTCTRTTGAFYLHHVLDKFVFKFQGLAYCFGIVLGVWFILARFSQTP